MPPGLDWAQVARGFLNTRGCLNVSTQNALEAASFLYSLIELLDEKGLISITELDARQPAVAKRLEERFRRDGAAVKLQDPEFDKYSFAATVEIDCSSRIALCRAACCKLPFALSRQDVHEGIVHWDLGNPYLIAQGADGWCEHLDRDNLCCTIRAHRPVPCRAYDCRREKRIWLDFDQRRINPHILDPDWPHCAEPAEGGAAA